MATLHRDRGREGCGEDLLKDNSEIWCFVIYANIFSLCFLDDEEVVLGIGISDFELVSEKPCLTLSICLNIRQSIISAFDCNSTTYSSIIIVVVDLLVPLGRLVNSVDQFSSMDGLEILWALNRGDPKCTLVLQQFQPSIVPL